uniref:Uncharacterized protein n=1 Tax=Oncorhynchus kisutch TaxID=8019 RepID=A0A8C7GUA9_ONCKI
MSGREFIAQRKLRGYSTLGSLGMCNLLTCILVQVPSMTCSMLPWDGEYLLVLDKTTKKWVSNELKDSSPTSMSIMCSLGLHWHYFKVF